MSGNRVLLDTNIAIYYLQGDARCDIVIKIRKQRKLKLPDAIIAATAIYLDIPLISADKAFLEIDGLKFIYNEPSVN